MYIVSACLQDGSTALMFAAQNGHMEVVKVLLGSPRCSAGLKDNVRMFSV